MLTLTVGRTYRAKRPAQASGLVNDRTIVWKSQDGSLVQYDGPAVRFGAHYPKVTSGKFSEWAGDLALLAMRATRSHAVNAAYSMQKSGYPWKLHLLT